jgi:RNA polymerase sigma-70 factor, ECF subfamily
MKPASNRFVTKWKIDFMIAVMKDVTTFEQYRRLLFAIAYRMLGGVAEAEDMVQETFLRWQHQGGEVVRSDKALLTTIITRLCIDHLKSARHQREQYVGVWLPEPLVEADENDPAKAAQLADSLTNAFLLMVETLSPIERAVFLLREVFDYDYADVSRIVGKSEANCRQMVVRSREHLAARRPRFDADPERAERLLNRFLRVREQGDSEGLLELLAEDAAIYSDGGGKVNAVRQPILGAARVARFFINIQRVYQRVPMAVQTRFAMINAEPGLLVFRDGKLEQSMTFELTDGLIHAIYVVRNPDKLKHLTQLN